VNRPASNLIIAIDGPAGVGKSSVAARIAEKFGLINLESGAMYRAFALKALTRNVDLASEKDLNKLAETTEIRIASDKGVNRVYLDGTEVTAEIRTPEVTAAASRVSVYPEIRKWMVSMQRQLGKSGGIVMEGRDIGSVVFPDADVKFFLDAAAEVRSKRRFEQNRDRQPQSAGAVLKELLDRDQRDRTRTESPLAPAPDAVLIDSTDLSLDEVLQRVESVIAQRVKSPH
jgi:cytidylate kinase